MSRNIPLAVTAIWEQLIDFGPAGFCSGRLFVAPRFRYTPIGHTQLTGVGVSVSSGDRRVGLHPPRDDSRCALARSQVEGWGEWPSRQPGLIRDLWIKSLSRELISIRFLLCVQKSLNRRSLERLWSTRARVFLRHAVVALQLLRTNDMQPVGCYFPCGDAGRTDGRRG